MSTEELKDTMPEEQKAEAGMGKKQKKEKKRSPVVYEIMSWICTLLAALIVAILLRTYVGEPVKVDGTSMTNTLKDGEIVFVSKLDYGKNGEGIQRNDIVICHYPNREQWTFRLGASLDMTSYTLFVKRVVALPGDTVQIKNGTLYVNGEEVPDPPEMGSVPMDYSLRYLGPDEYFVIGDNRRTSHDSRYSDVGPISADMIQGHVKCVIWPLNQIRSVE